MKPITNEVIWVTGATSGIGKALAEALSHLDNVVIISGRNEAILQEMAERHPGMHPLPFDVSNQASVEQAKAALRAKFEHIDRVVLNAGTCEYLDINQPDWALFSRTFDVNVIGPVNCLDIALPLLKGSRAPHIVGVASLASIAPFPRAEAYGASKAAFEYLLESLRMDVKAWGMDVSVILPGFVDTPLTQKNDFDMPFRLTVSDAANRMVNAIASRRKRYAFPKRLYWTISIIHAIPGLWAALITPKKQVPKSHEVDL